MNFSYASSKKFRFIFPIGILALTISLLLENIYRRDPPERDTDLGEKSSDVKSRLRKAFGEEGALPAAKNDILQSDKSVRRQWGQVLSSDHPYHPGGRTGALLDFAVSVALAGNPNLAVDLILQDVSDGQQRMNALKTCLAASENWSEFKKVFGKLNNLADKDEFHSVAGDFLATRIQEGTQSLPLSDLDLEFLEGNPSDVYARACKRLLLLGMGKGAIDREVTFNNILDLGFPSQSIDEILPSLSKNFAFDAWSYALKEKVQLSDETKASLARDLAATDILKAVEVLSETTEGQELLDVSIKLWLQNNLADPLKWFDENRSSLEATTSDNICGEIIDFACQNNDLPLAKVWINEITDENHRRQVEGKIWRTERKIVIAQTKESPERFFEEIIEGRSNIDDYWIKQGFETWFSENPDQANSWFQDNKRRLAPHQTQHVARAYAEVALGEGDINLARQWAEQVVDPNFKQKLVEQIDAAAGETE